MKKSNLYLFWSFFLIGVICLIIFISSENANLRLILVFPIFLLMPLYALLNEIMNRKSNSCYIQVIVKGYQLNQVGNLDCQHLFGQNL